MARAATKESAQVTLDAGAPGAMSDPWSDEEAEAYMRANGYVPIALPRDKAIELRERVWRGVQAVIDAKPPNYDGPVRTELAFFKWEPLDGSDLEYEGEPAFVFCGSSHIGIVFNNLLESAWVVPTQEAFAKGFSTVDAYLVPLPEADRCLAVTHEDAFGPYLFPLEPVGSAK